MQFLSKLLSRKFLITLGALWAIITAGDFGSPLRLAIIAGVATIYVVAEAVLDSKRGSNLVTEIGSAIATGLDTGKTALEGAAAGATATDDVMLPVSPAADSAPITLPFAADSRPEPDARAPRKATLLPPVPKDDLT